MSTKTTLATFAMVGALAFTSGCFEDERANRMNKNQKATRITHSVERDNINKRLQLANDPTQIQWIYCLSDMGQVVIESPVVGKVTSSSKRLEPRTTDDDYSKIVNVDGDKIRTTELMGADGTYGHSDPYVYWFTPEGQYLQWSGDYSVSSVPLKIAAPLLNVRDINYEEMARAKKAEQALKSGRRVSNNLEVLTQ